jgi:polysaccharide chain length determinant protein (PEP-CTERM system associated)
MDMTTEKSFNIQEYLEIGLRRKWYIIIPLVICVLGSFGVYKYLPKVYKATTLILVQPQKVPEAFVQSTITESVTDRLSAVRQEIFSRTKLEVVIQELNLYPNLINRVPMEDLVERMRNAITVEVQRFPGRSQPRSRSEQGQQAFSISFEGGDSRKVMMVTNKIASLFIEENLRGREMQAEGTSAFLNKELENMENQLRKKEEVIQAYKGRHIGNLPQQLEANLRILERLQQQTRTTSENKRAAEDRSIALQNQIEELRKREPSGSPEESQRGSVLRPGTERGSEDPLITQWNNLNRDLNNAQSKYTGNHPDVIELQRKIANLEPKVKGLLEKQGASRGDQSTTLQGEINVRNLITPNAALETERTLTRYKEQYNQAVLEVKRLQEEEKSLKEQIALYQKRIEDTPKREQELTLLSRDYDDIKKNYQSLLEKNMKAQMAENLERKQQGEQFRVLDPARLPVIPVKPDRNKILLMGGAIGLIAGLGLAWLRESMDQSFHTVSDIENYLEIPVLATIPNLNKGMKERKAA